MSKFMHFCCVRFSWDRKHICVKCHVSNSMHFASLRLVYHILVRIFKCSCLLTQNVPYQEKRFEIGIPRRFFDHPNVPKTKMCRCETWIQRQVGCAPCFEARKTAESHTGR